MTRRARRGMWMAALAVAAAACIDIGGPSSGVVSISNLTVAFPSVVIGDLLRDSLGAVAPLQLTAFDPSGNPIPGAEVTFVALDSTIRIDADGTVHGITRDTVGARVVAGAGGLQTAPARIFVSVAPQTATKGTAPTLIEFDITAPDTATRSNWSPALAVTLTGAGDVGAQGFIVSYEIIRAPAPIDPAAPAVYLADENGRRSARDTTDRQGLAGRIVVLRQQAIGDPALFAGTKTDTVIVRATARYLGVDLPATPIDFIIPVRKK